MLAFNDAWLINESLALHLSTNTFSNPAFDQDHIEPANYESPDGSGRGNAAHVIADDGHLSARPEQDKRSDQRKRRRGEKEKVTSQSFESSFADSLAFSIRSKLFVIDLNFKRKLRSLKAFAFRHFPGIFEFVSHCKQQKAQVDGSGGGGGGCNNNNNRGLARPLNRYKIHDEQFWENIVEPKSRKSLGKQEEKILNRLERALEQKRSQHDYYYHQAEYGSATKTSYNELEPSGGLRHIRPEIVDHPSYSGSLSSSSSSSRSSSASSTSGQPQSSSSSSASSTLAGGGEPIIIVSQNWAKRQRNCDSGKARPINKWKQIRDMVFDDGEASNSDPSNPKKLCIVCYTNMPNIMTLPCKHHDVCSDCFIEMIYIAVKKSQYPLKCALCRQKVEKIRCSRKLLLSVIEKQRIYP